ncbi:orotidine-5'-phosphate decarboxylase [Candidatus Marinamargulisbacteria bacterium SCGC AAA071-K20]|nr:orotidine-5'-phosphate decarboxylase [Candidatus Marinamargulisbacteria bacterium SCGC AAA071-K20]
MRSKHPVIQTLHDNKSRVNHCLCVGIDPDITKLPEAFSHTLSGLNDFLEKVIKDTSGQVLAYKPNISFFEALGIDGLKSLELLRKHIPENIPMILDAKRGDIGNTATMQAKYLFDYFGADASTLHPYMGLDSLEPFFKYKDKLHFVLGLTSNPSASNFEKLKLENGEPLYKTVISQCAGWNKEYGNVGVVVGATQSELKEIRKIDQDIIFLIPGVGAQGGYYEDAFSQGKNQDDLVVINASRSILYQNPELSFCERISQTIS